MTEAFRNYDVVTEQYVETKLSLWELVLRTISCQMSDNWVLFYDGEKDWAQRPKNIICASHFSGIGGYGLHKVALSPVGEERVLVIEKNVDQVQILRHESMQAPLHSQRDSFVFHQVGEQENEYFFADPSLTRALIDGLVASGAVYVESPEKLMPTVR